MTASTAEAGNRRDNSLRDTPVGISVQADEIISTRSPGLASFLGPLPGRGHRKPRREPQAPSRALPLCGDTRWDVGPSAMHTRLAAGSCTNENR